MRARVLSLPRSRRLVLLGAAVVALVLALPASASANPVKDAVHTALNAVFDTPSGDSITDGFFIWLIAIPNFNGTAFANLLSRTNLVAMALLTAVLTFSVVRYWLGAVAGTADGGAAAGMEGLIRTGGAVLAIMLWPWLFENVTALVNLTTRALLADGGVNTARLIGGSGDGLDVFNPVALAVKVLSFGMIIALGALKIFLVASIATLCAGAPFFIMLSPIRELAWVAANAGRALVVIWLAPIFWAFELRAADAIRIHDLLSPKGSGVGETLANEIFLEPLVGVVIMYMLFKTPKHLRAGIAQATNATVGAPGHVPPGFLARGASYLAAQLVGGLALSRIDANLGGRKQPAVQSEFIRDPTTNEVKAVQREKAEPGSARHTELTQAAEATTRQKQAAKAATDERRQRDRESGQRVREMSEARAQRLSRARAPKESDDAWNDRQAEQAKRAPAAVVAEAAKRGRESDAAWEQRGQEKRAARERDDATFATSRAPAEVKAADPGAAPSQPGAEVQAAPRRTAATGWSRVRDARAVESMLRDTEPPAPRPDLGHLPEPVRSRVEAEIAEFTLSEDSRR